MKFEFLADASDTPPKRPSNPSVGYPSNGDPVTGKPPTTPGAWFYYMLMVEFTTLIEQNGLEPSAENLHQLADVFADFKARASAAEGFATQAKASADAAAERASGVVTETASKIKEIQDEGSKQVSAVTAVGGSVSGDVEAGIASLQKKLEELVAQLDAEGGTEAAYIKQQAQDILDQITASEANARTSADKAAVSASSATTTISEGKQAITDLQATAVAAIQTQKNEAVAAVTATQSTATESVTAAQASSVSAVKAQEAASIQAIEADSVLAGYAKKDELSSLIAAAVAEAKLAAYPVGSIYCSIDSTDPGALFGGTWAAIGAGRALVAAGGGFAVGSEGGADTHTLTVEEMPSHAHTAWTGEAGWHGHTARTDTANLTGSFNPGGLGITASGVCSLGAGKQPSNSGYATDSSIVNINASHMHNVGVDGAGNHTHTVGVGATGGGQAFSVRNPYIAVNMWRRTA
jgi:microcystin-dependent protein